MTLGFRLLEAELDRVFEGQEMHFTPWYRREDYALIREIMEDGEDLPLAFDEWERLENRNRSVSNWAWRLAPSGHRQLIDALQLKRAQIAEVSYKRN